MLVNDRVFRNHMATSYLRYYWVLPVLLAVAAACQPPQVEPDPANPSSSAVLVVVPGSAAARLRVKSISEALPGNSARLTTFTYDRDGRLSGVQAVQTPDSTWATTERNYYQYDTKNRLIKHQHQIVVPASYTLVAPLAEEHQFDYNTDGLLTEIRYKASSGVPLRPNQTIVDLSELDGSGRLGYVLRPVYDAAKKVIGSQKAYYWQSTSATYASDYSYTGDLVTGVRTLMTINGTVSTPQTYSLSYDTKINPFYGVYVVPGYFGGIANWFLNLSTLSPNNITRVEGVSYRYEYNSANLPIVRYTVTDDKVIQTLRFAYESY